MYTLGIYLYIVLVRIAAFFGHKKACSMLKGHREVFRVLGEKVDPGKEYAWFHISSLGRFEQGRPMIERLRAEHPELRVVLTFFSPSGYNIAKNYQLADVVCYLPFDTKRNVRRFLDVFNPKMAFFVKSEFWLNYLLGLKKRNIPVYSISSVFRKNQVFFRPWGGYGRLALHLFDHLFVQDSKSMELLRSIGVENVSVVGDTRFDRVVKIAEQARQLPVVEAFVEGGSKVFVVGSSWAADEAVYMPFFNRHKEWKLIVVSHEVDDERIRRVESQYDGTCVRYSKASIEDVRKAGCLIIDCYGLLSVVYRYGLMAYVGGGFGPGVHNVLEAAAYGVPVFFGPENQRSRAAQMLKECGGAFEIASTVALEEKVAALTNDAEALEMAGKAAGGCIRGNAGASAKIFQAIGL